MSVRSKTVSIGVVGCGYWGPNFIRNFGALPNGHVPAICDLNASRLQHMQTLYPAAEQFADIDAMLAGSELDAVAIATPVHTHFALAKAALEAGKHVLVEKPMASSVAQCEELVKIADEKGLILMVGHTYLYSDPVNRIAEIISQGDIGEVQYINSQRLNLGLFQSDINVAWDLAPHDISLILHFMGRMPDSLNCQGNAHFSPGIEDVTNISLNFGSSQFATIQSSWLEPRKVRQMTIVGTRRMIIYDDLEPLEKLRVYDRRVERPPHYDSFAEFQCSYHYGDSYIPYIKQREPLSVLAAHFLDCIATGAQPITSGREGTELVKILEACSESLAGNGAPVPLKKNAAVGAGSQGETISESARSGSSRG